VGITFDPARGGENRLVVVLLVAMPLLAVAVLTFAYGDENAKWFYAVTYICTILPTYLVVTKLAGHVRPRWMKRMILGIWAVSLGVYTLVSILLFLISPLVQ
jgi:hypothetical protein